MLQLRLEIAAKAARIAAVKAALQVGFTPEGVERAAADDGADLLRFAMLKDECRWIGDGIRIESAGGA